MRQETLVGVMILALSAAPSIAQEDDEGDHHGDLGHTAHEELETIVVSALPFARRRMDSAQPIDVIAGERLDDRRGATLGETLMQEPGVHASAYGAGASRPIIRGLGGPRVRILEDSIPAVDVSAQSDDHAISVEPMLVDRIEILRGPATLLYGSGAVGGVVNVIDNRIPEQVPVAPLEGRFELRGDSVADERTGVLRLDGGGGNWAWHVDGSWRDADDYRIPVAGQLEDEHEDEEHDNEDHAEGSTTLHNSFVETQSGSAGLSWIGDRGFIGTSFKVFESEYGIPAPHGHEDEDDQGEGLMAEGGHGEEDEESIFIDLDQTRWDIKGGLNDPLPGFSRALLRVSYNDYTHAELERENGPAATGFETLDPDNGHDHEEHTVFDIEAVQSRLELEHRPVAGWRGAIGAQFEDRSLTAEGEEAFIPDGDTRSWGLFALEEKQVGDLTWTLGARVERNRIALADDLHGHDDHEDEEDEAQDELDLPDQRSFTTWSASAGALWAISDQWQAALNYSHVQRAPSQTELYADGPHAATFTFEEGNAFLDRETTDAFDLIVHRHGERVDFEISLFYNDFDDFIFLEETDAVEDGLPVRETRQQDAEFYGGEAHAVWQVAQGNAGNLDLRVGYDWVRGRLDSGDNLPRISPARYSAGLDWHLGELRANIEYQHVRRQDRTAPLETETAGYDMVDLGVSYFFHLRNTELEAFARAKNLLDEEARVHTSFLKNFAPLPGRNYTFGLRGRF